MRTISPLVCSRNTEQCCKLFSLTIIYDAKFHKWKSNFSTSVLFWDVARRWLLPSSMLCKKERWKMDSGWRAFLWNGLTFLYGFLRFSFTFLRNLKTDEGGGWNELYGLIGDDGVIKGILRESISCNMFHPKVFREFYWKELSRIYYSTYLWEVFLWYLLFEDVSYFSSFLRVIDQYFMLHGVMNFFDSIGVDFAEHCSQLLPYFNSIEVVSNQP